MKHHQAMRPKGFFRHTPSKVSMKKTGSKNETRFTLTLRRENLSLAGCSSAEPVSVSVQHLQNSLIETIFTNCQKSLPFTQGPLSIKKF